VNIEKKQINEKTFDYTNWAGVAYGTFWVYSFICVLGFLYIKKKLPETKGKSLEEIENEIIKEDTRL
jgi:hypothetical protein